MMASENEGKDPKPPSLILKPMEKLLGKVVMPGDVLFELNPAEVYPTLIFGPGLRLEDDKIIAEKCGPLKWNRGKVFYIDNHQKRYTPNKGENVVGIVVKITSDEAMVDIGSSEPAVIDLLSFEGATQRNKPQLKIGDLLFAKIITAYKYMEPELVCIDSYGKSAGYGLLGGGFFITVSLHFVRRLLFPNCHILRMIGQYIPFECAIGINGRIWVKSTTIDNTMTLVQILTSLEFIPPEEFSLLGWHLTTLLEGDEREQQFNLELDLTPPKKLNTEVLDSTPPLRNLNSEVITLDSSPPLNNLNPPSPLNNLDPEVITLDSPPPLSPPPLNNLDPPHPLNNLDPPPPLNNLNPEVITLD